jgi:chitinase
MRGGIGVARLLPVLCSATALCLAAAALAHAASASARSHAIIGYVYPGDAPLDPASVPADRLTHVNFAFANIRDGEVVEGGPRDAANLAVLTALREKHPHLRILISVGGWTWSKGFSDAALTAASRERFVASALAFAARHRLDGIDIDWEYPGLEGDGNVHRSEDREHFTLLMSALRAALDASVAGAQRRPLLTFAAGAFDDYIAHTEMAKVAEVVDFVNLMTYDFRVQGADPIAGHHANLQPSPFDDRRHSVAGAVRAFLAAGVPARKLVVGVPFYGRPWQIAAPTRRGLYEAGTAPDSHIDASHTNLAAHLIDRDGYVRAWDEDAQAPFLWNEARRIFISYEDAESLRRKCALIRDRSLGGAMFWQLGDDRTGTLLRVLADELP